MKLINLKCPNCNADIQVNEELEKGFTILEVCNKINISYNTIRDRFLRNNYIYNKTTKKSI